MKPSDIYSIKVLYYLWYSCFYMLRQQNFKEGGFMVYRYIAKSKRIRNETIYEKITQRTDPRVHWIYEQFLRGKALTLDDLKYMSKKDIEGCRMIINALIENQEIQKNKQRKQVESAAFIHINQIEQAVLLSQERLSHKSSRSKMEPKQTIENVKESLTNVKQMVLVMSWNELQDMMNHLNHVSELQKKYVDELQGWQMFLEETDRYYIPCVKPSADYRV